MMILVQPFALLLFLPGLAWLFWMKTAAGSTMTGLPGNWSRMIDTSLQELAARRAGYQEAKGGIWLMAIIWGLLVLALAQPEFETHDGRTFGNLAGRIIVLDLGSGASVNAERVAAVQLLDASPDVPTAIVAASGDAFDVMPLTTDRRQIDRYLEVMDVKVMPVAGRDLRLALAHGEAVLTRAGIIAGQVVLVTGGDRPKLVTVKRAQPLRAVVTVDSKDTWQDYADGIDARLVGAGSLAPVLRDLELAIANATRNLDGIQRRRIAPWLIGISLLLWLGLFRRREAL